MKIKSLIFFIAIATIAMFSSCNKEEDTIAKPTITLLELGLGNSHIAYIGADLHIEAEIVAEGKINTITVEIHQEEGSSEEIDTVFTEFAGLKNTTFHKHVDIPSTTPAGTYHCHIIVTDMEGNSTTLEDEIIIAELVDNDAPIINISSAPTNGQIFTSGETISMSGTITDNTSLAGLVVALVYTSDNISDEDVAGNNTKVIVMLHTHSFDSEDSHAFTTSINVDAVYDNNMTPALIQGDNAWKAGNYYILVKGKDAKGNWAYSSHHSIEINI